jgi:CheY-like chemotaxis protein
MRVPTPPASKARVLVVDDDSAALQTLAAVLSDEFEVVTSSTPQRAVELFRRGEYDVVCTDFHMRGMTGVELIEKLLELKRPVGCVLVTGATEISAARKLAVGDNANVRVVAKPYDPDALIALIRQLASLAGVRRAVRGASNSIQQLFSDKNVKDE